MQKLLHQGKLISYFFLSYILSLNLYAENQESSYDSDPFEKLTSPDAFLKAVSKLYLSSLPLVVGKETKAEKTPQTLNRKIYEVETPHLTNREQGEIVFKYIIKANHISFLDFFEKTKSDGAADIVSATAEMLNLVSGAAINPQLSLLHIIMEKFSVLGKIAMAILLMRPITNVKALRKNQGRLKTLVDYPKEKEKMRNLIKPIQKVSSSLLALYSPKNELMLSSSYQQRLSNIYAADSENKFSRWRAIEFKRRMRLDLPIMMTLLLLCAAIYAHISFALFWFNIQSRAIGPIGWCTRALVQTWQSKNWGMATWLLAAMSSLAIFGCIAMLFQMLFMSYKLHKTITDYVSGRLADFQKVIEIAVLVDQVVRKNPELEKYFGDQLNYTRKVLSLQHDNSSFNQLIAAILHNDFKKFSVFFNSPGTLLTTMTLLIDNLHVLDGILFELGMIEAWLAASDLISHNEEGKNQYSYVTYQEGSKPYIHLSGVWNPLLGNEAPLNEFKADQKQEGHCITRTNISGSKKMYGSAVGIALILSHTIGVTPASESVVSLLGGFFVLKENQNDTTRKKSSPATEVKELDVVFGFLHNTQKDNYEACLIFYDEFPKRRSIGWVFFWKKVSSWISIFYSTKRRQ